MGVSVGPGHASGVTVLTALHTGLLTSVCAEMSARPRGEKAERTLTATASATAKATELTAAPTLLSATALELVAPTLALAASCAKSQPA